MASYQSTILADTPQAFWRLNETSGNPVDSSGNSNSLIYPNVPTYQQSPLIANDSTAHSVTFNDFNQFAYSSTYIPFVSGSTITLEGWFFVNYTANLNILFAGGNASNQGGAYLTTGGAFSIPNSSLVWAPAGNVGNGGVTATWNNAITDSSTFHLVLIHNDSTGAATLYINGVSQGTKTGLDKYLSGDNSFFIIGCWQATGVNAYFLGGNVEECAVYNYGLTSTQVLTHFNAGSNVASMAWVT